LEKGKNIKGTISRPTDKTTLDSTALTHKLEVGTLKNLEFPLALKNAKTFRRKDPRLGGRMGDTPDS